MGSTRDRALDLGRASSWPRPRLLTRPLPQRISLVAPIRSYSAWHFFALHLPDNGHEARSTQDCRAHPYNPCPISFRAKGQPDSGVVPWLLGGSLPLLHQNTLLPML